MKGSPLLRNLGYNSNSSQNQNMFQPTARNLLGNGFVNIEFSNEPIPYSYRPIENGIETYNAANAYN